MDFILTMTLFISVLQVAFGFNIESSSWRSLSNPDPSFGYQVVQRQSDLLVSAPLLQTGTKRGRIFHCLESGCNPLEYEKENTAVNMSLGLAMANDPTTESTMVCGPTIPRDCKSITMYNGLCFEINKNNQPQKSFPSATEECAVQADIAIVMDGSGSVGHEDFKIMKDFVKSLIKSFLEEDTQFAIIQFSDRTTIHFDFNTFNKQNWENGFDGIQQQSLTTYTAQAIKDVVDKVFSSQRGSRPYVKKILIVITDGASSDRRNLKNSISLADRKKIVRFAIGVGYAFVNQRAKEELETIASKPAKDFVFQVGSFAALNQIQNNLQTKIFLIEGSQSGGETLKQEMSQAGFSAAYASGYIQMAMVGVNQWRGGYKKYLLSNSVNVISFEPSFIEPDSYLGYSMAVAQTNYGPLTVMGAPRNQHTGIVLTVFSEIKRDIIRPFQIQSGAYFGAEVCAMDVDSDGITDLILISSPMYKDHDREGRVYVCQLNSLSVLCYFENPPLITTLRGAASDRGRFGLSLAVLPDINADTFNDLAVGAPLENDGQGSIYIFRGEGGGNINPTYSQRISANEVKPGLKFFGISISQSSYDQSNDRLPDLAVGAKGKVVLLRSRPVVTVSATVTFGLDQIPTQKSDCLNNLATTANVCFTMSKVSSIDQALAQVNFTLILDANRKIPNHRAAIDKNLREKSESLHIQLNQKSCQNVNFYILPCPEDVFNPLQNELSFTFEGLSLGTEPRPSLSPKVVTRSFHSINYEITCGKDEKCVDDLKVDFNFTGSSEVKVGIDELLNVTVFVKNRGENSYNTRVSLTYPVALSYRKFTSLGRRIECNSFDSEDGVTRGRTVCSIDKPIFKDNSVALFIVSYGHNANSDLSRRIFVTANAYSDNNQTSSSAELYKRKEIDVKYSIYITIDSTPSYNNFTFGENALQKPVEQNIKVSNVIRALNLTVVIRVPIKLGDKDIWMDTSSFQILGCQSSRDEEPIFTDFVVRIKENNTLDCSVAKCRVFKCSGIMERNKEILYTISANISSRWIEQIGLSSAKFLVTSTASLEYDRNQYVFFSTTSNNEPPVYKFTAEVEVFQKPDFTKEIVGGSLGGLAFLILLSTGLAKAGFFKSKYKEMINENADVDPGAEGDAPTE